MSRPHLLRVDTMSSTEIPDISTTPVYLMAVLMSARRSRDRALERVTRRRLEALGVHVTFADELPLVRTEEDSSNG